MQSVLALLFFSVLFVSPQGSLTHLQFCLGWLVTSDHTREEEKSEEDPPEQ